VDPDGLPIAPFDIYGDDVLWWLDRMVRSTQPFVERMALIWHDWFATADVRPQLAIQQSDTFRTVGLTTFSDLLQAVTSDPAMLVWLSGLDNDKHEPNENYGREMMELFSLGASDTSGYPYSEDDVRENARALTGWCADWVEDLGYDNFHFDSSRFDSGAKTIFGQTGNFDWKDSCRLCIQHPAHPPFFINKLWSYFIPVPPSAKDRKALERQYVQGGYAIRPIVEAILMHPRLYRGPSMVKAPVVYTAGLHRARRRGISGNWAWLSEIAGQRLFSPPNVGGWDDAHWLDTSTFRGRWLAANALAMQDVIDTAAPYDDDETPTAAVKKALSFWANPVLGPRTRKCLMNFAQTVEQAVPDESQKSSFRAMRQNALRLLIATSPDLQTS
jgi:uncharacterized protein (DUF1800 family)